MELRPGDLVHVSLQTLHRDPALYQEPDAFRPEHFSEEEVASRPKSTYLVFGDGPRMCIGGYWGLGTAD